MIKKSVKVMDEVGLHARPAAQFVQKASKFKASILVRNITTQSESVDAKSILSVLGLGVEKDHEIEIAADGADEVVAVEELCSMVSTPGS